MIFLTGNPPAKIPGVAFQSTSGQGRSRSAPPPVQPRTPSQQRIRTGFSAGSKGFALLNACGQEAWGEFSSLRPRTAATVQAVIPVWPRSTSIPGYPDSSTTPPSALILDRWEPSSLTLFGRLYTPPDLAAGAFVYFSSSAAVPDDSPFVPLLESSYVDDVGWADFVLGFSAPPVSTAFFHLGATRAVPPPSSPYFCGWASIGGPVIDWGGVYPSPYPPP